MGRGEQWGEGVRVGDLVKRAEFRARLTGDRGGRGLKMILSFSLVFGGQYAVLVDLWENILNVMKYIIVIF